MPCDNFVVTFFRVNLFFNSRSIFAQFFAIFRSFPQASFSKGLMSSPPLLVKVIQRMIPKWTEVGFSK